MQMLMNARMLKLLSGWCRRTQAERASLGSELEEAIEMVCSHKFEIQEIIKRTVEHVHQQKAKFDAQQWEDLSAEPSRP